MHQQAELGDGFREGLEEQMAVLIGAENLTPLVAPRHDVIDGALELDSDRSGHDQGE